MSAQRIDTAVIGGGQAGLALSYYLTQQGRAHVVLEQGRVAESWRSKRWDSLTLVGPNWTLQLPGFPYQGADPDGFMAKDDVTTFLERYAQSFQAPLRTGVRVIAVEDKPAGDGYVVRMEDTTCEATNVVIATGEYQVPKIPPCGAHLPPEVMQIAAYQYRRPEALPPGAVLVVGSGESGCQIAEELRHTGRTVYLSTGTTGWVPRRYRGRDCIWWAVQAGLFEQTVDTLPPGRPKYVGPQVTSTDGGHDLNLHTLARAGIILLGRLRDIDADRVRFAPDLHENIAKSDAVATNFANAIDAYIHTHGIDAPVEDLPRYTQAYDASGTAPLLELDVKATRLATVIWATGYRPDFSWLRVPVFDAEGYPIHKRGVTSHSGLYFLGLDWLHKRRSGMFLGIGEDAEYLASCIATRTAHGG
jgi:putative flavoprotein involved in K+ transport